MTSDPLPVLPAFIDAVVIFRAIGTLVAWKVLQIFYRLYLHPLSKIPGPPLAKVTELWRTSRYFNGDWHDDVRRLHKQYGGVVRIAPNEVSVVDIELPNTVYSIAHGTAKVRIPLEADSQGLLCRKT